MKRVPPIPVEQKTNTPHLYRFHLKIVFFLQAKIFTSNWFGAGGASLGEQFSKAVSTVRLVVAGRESLASQGIVTVAAGEAISVPRLVLVCHTTAGNNL